MFEFEFRIVTFDIHSNLQ